MGSGVVGIGMGSFRANFPQPPWCSGSTPHKNSCMSFDLLLSGGVLRIPHFFLLLYGRPGFDSRRGQHDIFYLFPFFFPWGLGLLRSRSEVFNLFWGFNFGKFGGGGGYGNGSLPDPD